MGRLKIYDDKGKLQNFDPSGNMIVTDVNAQTNTLTVEQIVGGIIVHTSTSGAGNVTIDSAANIISGFEGNGILQDIGDTITCYYINDGSEILTLIVDGDITIADAGQTIAANESALLIFRKTSATAVTVYSVGA